MSTTARLLFVCFLASASLVSAQSLSDLRWQKRVLVIYAPPGSEEKLAQQTQLLEARIADLRERDLVQIILRQPSDHAELAPRFPRKTFTVLLLGKDGGEKLRSSRIVQPDALFRLIDSMPMRRDEMRRD